MIINLAKYYEIAKQLRDSINAKHCFDCPFRKRCNELYDDGTNDWDECDAIRVKIIEEKLQEKP